MSKIDEARSFLQAMGMPRAQQADLCCYSLLAMTGVTPENEWKDATNEWIRIHDILQSTSRNFNVKYAENSRETFRKQAMHHFRNAALTEDNGKATNSPNYRYRITEEALLLIQCIGSSTWEAKLAEFKAHHSSLVAIYASKKTMQKMPVNINGASLTFSPGSHNFLQKLIIEEFAPRFAPHSECLYVGDTIAKDLVKNVDKLEALGFEITLHDKMPDIVLFREDRNWIYFIESVTSVGPMDPKRIIEINEMTTSVRSGKIYITAFLDFKTFKLFSEFLAWETEVWIADMPDHMLHLNGDKFLGPRN
ncbi:MAG: BsuBI/PstI family type II restriction endonuclease [Bacillota bacterium]